MRGRQDPGSAPNVPSTRGVAGPRLVADGVATLEVKSPACNRRHGEPALSVLPHIQACSEVEVAP